MSRIAATRWIWTLLAAGGIWLATAGPATALTWYWGAHPDKERLVLVLDRPADGYSLERTGKQALTLTLPPAETGTLKAQSSVKPLGNAKLLGKPTGSGRTITIPTKTAAFGYISTTVSGNKIVVDLFRDPIGARWKPRKDTPKPAAVVQPQDAAPVPAAAAEKPVEPKAEVAVAPQTPKPAASPPASPLDALKKVEVPVRGKKTEQKSAQQRAPIVERPGTRSLDKVLPPPLNEKVLVEGGRGAVSQTAPHNASQSLPQPPQEPVETVPAQPAPKVSSPPERPFFAVPYTYRSRINTGGPEDWKEQVRPPAPVVVDSPMPNAEGSIRARVSKAPEAWREDAPTDVPQEAVAIARKIQDAKLAMEREKAEKLAREQAEKQIQAENARLAKEQAVAGKTPKEKAGGSQVSEAGKRKEAQPAPVAPAQVPPAASEQVQAVAQGPEFSVRAKVAPPGQVTTLRRSPDAPRAPQGAKPVAEQGGDVPMPPAGSASVPAVAPKPAQPVPGDGGADRFAVSDQAPHAPKYPDLKPAFADATEPKVAPEPVTVPEPQMEEVVSNKPAPPEPKVVYVDKDGNPIPPPPDPKDLLFQAQAALNNGEAAAALEQFKALKRMPKLTEEQRAEVLNGIADSTYALGKDDLLANYEKIIQATTEAMNYNLKSDSVPSHLLRLAMTNMKIGNVREAEAYFNILRKNYPNSDLIPLTYYYWGDYYFNKGEWQKAADNFQYVVQNYPDSKYVRESGVGLARALYSLGFYDQAFQIVDYVEKRWPRFYLEYPPFLSQMGDVEYRMKKYDKARITYWTYYNIDPDGDEADMILARLGDLYVELRERDAAREVYEEAARKFPDRDGGLIALMRLAEEGVFDSPTLAEMFSIFDRPYNLRPLQIYSKIIEDHPDSALVPLARLKKSMWYLWNKQYPEALTTATSFIKQHAGHELTGRVKEVALKAFNVMVADNIREGNYERILQIWDQFPIVRGQDTELAPESRIALGLSYWKQKQPSKALEVIDPFFLGLKIPETSEMALNLALSIYLDNERWADVVNLAQRIELWDLNPESRKQLDYALALAYENMGEHDKASPMWDALAKVQDVPLDQEAYTLFFLSREAERKEDWETAYRHAKQSLIDFRELAKRDPDKGDPQKIKDLLGALMDITERTGRAKEALDWAREYAQDVKPTDPDYPGMQYRIAGLYKKNANLEKWRAILTELRDSNPNSLYGRMAASELRTYDLTEGASKFSPTGRL
ncbi:tetratricopeptide repeat protein [Desulfovibrio mangrovi]|uniref:tetratricopeptide repeat protein n=1 Tax=Desulfovibrio mangrovi TaxID=2976983 RepID=UPI0022457916|nr:tetratricopeptide repeat protein [Desulfovibrio mangrovi]UZP67172.1 tetratricopeptide repeat protein [Desulfovibrio mangrovi]